MKFFDNLGQWLANSRFKTGLVLILSALEATVLPIPLEVILVPLMLRFPNARWSLAIAALIGCLIGAVGGYYIGFFLMDTLGNQIIDLFGLNDLDSFRESFADHAFWAILAVGVSPIPFQSAMLVAGAAKFSLLLFLLATLIARSLRYLGLAWLVGHYGERAERIWNENKLKFSLIALGLAVLAWALAQLVGKITFG